jgi:uncharacterized protein (TIGR03086 family)
MLGCGTLDTEQSHRGATDERSPVVERSKIGSEDGQLEALADALSEVGALIDNVRPEQWAGPTPCTDWSVRRLIEHLTGLNLVFTAILRDQQPPVRKDDDAVLDDERSAAYSASAAQLLAAFAQPGVFERDYRGPLGTVTGAERLQIRLCDLIAHGWDLARATGQELRLPDDVVEQSLTFVQRQLSDDARPGRFEPAQPAPSDAPAIERLAAFLGRPVGEWPAPGS